MKKIILATLALCLILVGVIYLYALPDLEKKIISSLSSIGINDSQIQNVSLNLNGVKIEKIFLDTEKISVANNIHIQLSWPIYLIKKKIESIEVGNANIFTMTDTYQSFLKAKSTLKKITSQKTNIDTISIRNIIWNTKLPNGDLRFLSDLNITNKDNQNLIEFKLEAQQYEMSFFSQWEGVINQNNIFSLQGDIKDLKINYGPFSINRAAGWIALQAKGDKEDISGQLEAGSGSIHKIPVNNVSLTLGQANDHYPLLFRAESSGIKGISVTSDIHYSETLEKQHFETNLKIDNLEDFSKYLALQNIIPNSTKVSMQNINVQSKYTPEKRFADGPYPFDTSINSNNKNIAEGTILIYPNSLDTRGTITTKDSGLQAITSVLPISEENIIGNTIRIDSNLKSLIQ